MVKHNIYIGLDPGKTGGLSIIEKDKVSVYPIPVKTIIVNKKKKNVYDLMKISNILRPYSKKKVLFIQEKVGSRPFEGTVSSFNFGESVGATKGIAAAFEFNTIEVTPRTWKKHYPELETVEIQELRKENKDLRIVAKTIKGKGLKKENKKQQEKIARKIKSLAKEAARHLSQLKYPLMKDKFFNVNTDGIAESLLIALYAKENYNKLWEKNELV